MVRLWALLLLLLPMWPDTARMAYVRTCDSQLYVRVWADSARTIPVANPFVVPADGRYKVYAQASCVSVEVK